MARYQYARIFAGSGHPRASARLLRTNEKGESTATQCATDSLLEEKERDSSAGDGGGGELQREREDTGGKRVEERDDPEV